MGNLPTKGEPGLSKAELERMERRWVGGWDLLGGTGLSRLVRASESWVGACQVYARHLHKPTPPARLPHRLKRLGRGEKELAQSDLQMLPELAGNPFLPRIFQLYDQDGDGYITAADMRSLLESLARLGAEEERYQCKRARGGRRVRAQAARVARVGWQGSCASPAPAANQVLTPPHSRTAVAFRVFDADEDQFVTQEDLLRWLRATNRRGLSDAQLEQILHSTIAQFDEDGDGQLSYPEFRSMVSAASTERNMGLAF